MKDLTLEDLEKMENMTIEEQLEYLRSINYFTEEDIEWIWSSMSFSKGMKKAPYSALIIDCRRGLRDGSDRANARGLDPCSPVHVINLLIPRCTFTCCYRLYTRSPVI